MSLIPKQKEAEETVVATCVAPSIRCSNPECNARLGRAHFFGSGGWFEFEKCCSCGKGTRIENTPDGIVVKQLAPHVEKKPPVRRVVG